MRREDTLSNSRTSRTLHRVVGGTCAFATGFGLLRGEVWSVSLGFTPIAPSVRV